MEQFRQEAQQLSGGGRGGALPFAEVLRTFAVHYVEQKKEAGGTVVEAAAQLGCRRQRCTSGERSVPEGIRR